MVSTNGCSAKDLLTNSRAAAYLGCPRLHLWRYECGLVPAKAALILRFGSAYHLGLSFLHNGLGGEPAAAAAMASMDPEDEPDRTIVAGLLHGWAWRWEARGWKMLATERVFRLRLGRAHWKLAGKIDAIVELADGRTAIVEHKTTSEDIAPRSDYWRRVLMDRQIAWYVAGARSLGYEPDTVIYDAVRKPGIRPKIIDRATGERESRAQYAERLAEDIAERPDRYYGQHEIPRLDHEVRESLEDAASIMGHIRQSRREGSWPRNTDHCRRWGICPYFGPCADGHDPRDGTPNESFVRVEDVHLELQNDDAESDAPGQETKP